MTFPPGGGGGLAVTVSPPSASGSGTTNATPSVTATPSGGVAPFTYLWEVTSGSHPLSIGFPAAASTNFGFSGVEPGDFCTGTVKVTVTSSDGRVGTAHVDVSYLNTEGGGGA